MDIIHHTMRHILDIMRQSTLTTGYLQQAVLKALVGEILVALGIHDADAIDDEAVGIHIRSRRTEGSRPEAALLVVLHRISSCELHIDHDILRLIVFVAESHCAVFVANGLSRSDHAPA